MSESPSPAAAHLDQRSNVVIRRAVRSDAPAMVSLLNAIIAKGGTTAHSAPFTVDQMIEQYIAVQPPFGISCMVAVLQETDRLVGFQALEGADPDWPSSGEEDENKLDADWSIIATFVDQDYHRKGIGRRLFEATLAQARVQGVTKIDATIRVYNKTGQAFYDRMGFKDYHSTEQSISKRFDVT